MSNGLKLLAVLAGPLTLGAGLTVSAVAQDVPPPPMEQPLPPAPPAPQSQGELPPEAAPAATPPEAPSPPPTIDSNGDGTMDAWDQDGNGVADSWDTDGDGKADAIDANGDGVPDAVASAPTPVEQMTEQPAPPPTDDADEAPM